jgi:hypothetical protein
MWKSCAPTQLIFELIRIEKKGSVRFINMALKVVGSEMYEAEFTDLFILQLLLCVGAFGY